MANTASLRLTTRWKARLSRVNRCGPTGRSGVRAIDRSLRGRSDRSAPWRRRVRDVRRGVRERKLRAHRAVLHVVPFTYADRSFRWPSATGSSRRRVARQRIFASWRRMLSPCVSGSSMFVRAVRIASTGISGRATLNLEPDKRDLSKAKKRQVEQLARLHDDLGFAEEGS